MNRWKSHSLLASGTFNFFLKAASRAEMRTHLRAAKHDDALLRMRQGSFFRDDKLFFIINVIIIIIINGILLGMYNHL